MSKGEIVFVVIVILLIVAAMWVAPLFVQDKNLNLKNQIYVTIIGLFLIFFVVKYKNQITKPKNKFEQYTGKVSGWYRLIYSYIYLIGGIVFTIAGILMIFKESKYWYLGLLAILAGCGIIYLSRKVRIVAKEILEKTKSVAR